MQNIFSISNLIFALRLRRLPLRFDICRSSTESELSSLVDGEDEVKEKSEKREMKNFFWFVFLFMQKKIELEFSSREKESERARKSL